MKVPFLDLGAAAAELRPELDAAWHRVMDSGWFVMGRELQAFEAGFADACGAEHCLGVASGLDALVLVLRAWDIGPGDEVIVPGHTFIATWLAVSQVGAVPVPVEVDPLTCNIDVAAIQAAITPATRAIVPVHLYGQPADMVAIMALADARGIKVLADAAQAHGATVAGGPVGRFGHASAWSFYPGKNLGAYGDGGAITTDDAELAERIGMLRNYGSKVKYHHELQGVNSRLDELQAALLRVRLRHLDDWNARRAAIAERYLRDLAGIPGLQLPVVAPGRTSSWHLFVVQHEDRDGLQARLAGRGVHTLMHYPVPPHRCEAYAESHGDAALPISERVAETVLSLPIGPQMSAEHVDWTVQAVRELTR